MPLATNPFTQEVAAGNAQIGRWLSLCSKFIAMRWPCPRHAFRCDYVRLRKFEALEVAVSTHYVSNLMGLPGSKPAIPQILDRHAFRIIWDHS